MFKRIGLFLATNLAVIVLLNLVLMVLEGYFGIRLGNTGITLVIATLAGFGGAMISLLISKWVAKRSTGMHVIEQPSNELEQWLVSTVRRQADAAGIKMPEVGIYDAPDINAFATGPSRNNSLVAVSTGLLRSMSRDEAEAVLGHEISHAANGDMVTMALIQGVLNTFVIVLSRVVGRIIDSAIFGNREGGGLAYILIVTLLNIAFGLLAQIVVMWFSRWREFHADAGGARLAGKEKMIAALERLALNHGQAAALPTAISAFGISGSIARGVQGLFMSHPPLEVRIQKLRES
ncbi:protease HtpX [Arenimonas oryziterrae]|uniref:Protease HtpX n=1 Tax=Arenimonas oryziterrae DSM 21050 = YC6267 TaxID=1121015 RepID=A0A091AYQ7_9GAMM|nr:protease HtpX [Arenimonas oryziterrae]KFN44566.1 hypothetical protein N789_00735 [Arenimonas oryziterrae DSM 21050 = YC6267]